ncbi:MAG: 30S ribosomal protein S9, partial [bacterium]
MLEKKKNIKNDENNLSDAIVAVAAAEDNTDRNIRDVKAKKKAYIYNTGKRKTAIASVRIYKKGAGEVEINGKKYDEYFKESYLQEIAIAPLELVTQRKNVNVTVRVKGGGK